jgi:hypothetical protein
MNTEPPARKQSDLVGYGQTSNLGREAIAAVSAAIVILSSPGGVGSRCAARAMGFTNSLSPVGCRRSFLPNVCRRPTAPPTIVDFQHAN